jgi:hypothetical protein
MLIDAQSPRELHGVPGGRRQARFVSEDASSPEAFTGCSEQSHRLSISVAREETVCGQEWRCEAGKKGSEEVPEHVLTSGRIHERRARHV